MRRLSIALNVCGIRNLALGKLKSKYLILMGAGFGINSHAVLAATEEIGKQLPKAIIAVENSAIGTMELRKKLIDKMEK